MPIFNICTAWLIKNKRISQVVHFISSLIVLISGIYLFINVTKNGPLYLLKDYIYIDVFNGFFIFILVIVLFIVTIYSFGYISVDLQREVIKEKNVTYFFVGFYLFMLTIISVMILNNLALVWIAIEFTTLASALLIAFYRRPSSLEAAWKYLIIGSLGITFALFGILFIFASSTNVVTNTYDAFNWTVLIDLAHELDPMWVTIGFVFVLIGYGTKAGLAPLHFWLPDAHSEAPSPISAILSGVLLNTALYGMLRIYLIVNESLQGAVQTWLIFFGLFSVGLMVPFILVQQNYKRMLAYSSVEHIGVIVFGIGIGGPLGIYGAMLHTLNHSLVKSMLFMAAGNISQKFNSVEMQRVTALFKRMPFTSVVYTIGILAIAGTPPLNIFISEWTIMLAGFGSERIGLTILFIASILIIFAGMIAALGRMTFGKPEGDIKRGEVSLWTSVPLIFPLILVIVSAFYIPAVVEDAIMQIVTMF